MTANPNLVVFWEIPLYNVLIFATVLSMTHSLDILTLIMQAGMVVKAIMGLLLLLSLIGWTLIFRLSQKLRHSWRFDQEFQAWFWSSNSLKQQYQSIANDDDRLGLEQVFYAGYNEFLQLNHKTTDHAQLLHALERTFRITLGKQQAQLEQGLPVLASIGSVSPYIGLFGTVWGIMTAFIGLSDAQSVTLATVAPGIAEALIATAIGLFAAIPATLAFNHFTAKANNLYESRSLFCDELLSVFARHHIQGHSE